MLIVELFNSSAVWNNDEEQWVSRDKVVASLLNDTLPEELGLVDTPYLIGGEQGLVLAAARARYGNDLKVLKETAVDAPDEVEGEVA